MGSGATFTSASSNTISSVTSGTLTQSNSKDGEAIFDLPNMKPGDTVNGTVTITNTGSLPATFTLTESQDTNTFAEDMLTLTITDGATLVYSGNFGGFDAAELGTFASEEARTYTFSVALDEGADNSQQNKTAGAIYTWDAIQLDGETFTQ